MKTMNCKGNRIIKQNLYMFFPLESSMLTQCRITLKNNGSVEPMGEGGMDWKELNAHYETFYFQTKKDIHLPGQHCPVCMLKVERIQLHVLK